MYGKLKKRIVMKEGYEHPSHSTHADTGMYATVTEHAHHAHATGKQRVMHEAMEVADKWEDMTYEKAIELTQKAERDYLGMKQKTVSHETFTNSMLEAGTALLMAYETMTCDK